MANHALTLDYARELDRNDKLRHLRNEFIIPSKSGLKRKKLGDAVVKEESQGIYLCGNSLGLQPKKTKQYIDAYLSTWSSMGVYGHFKPLEDAVTVPWVEIGDQAAEAMCKIVGALLSEVAVMQTLTANLHLLMASFYRPNEKRWKIIIEGKAFPSDHYAVYSQLTHHNLSPDSVILIEPDKASAHRFTTEHILKVIEEHAENTALLLLPAIQFYSGQYFDIPTITAYAQERGIIVGWDCAHAAGNVPLKLHDWNVDFAAWCSYKYINAGPGSIAGLFVHERHGKVNTVEKSTASSDSSSEKSYNYTPRLSGWWGSDLESRFKMENIFKPIPGAAGWQLSNPSVFDCTSLIASLSIFNSTTIEALREKSERLTAHLENLLEHLPCEKKYRRFTILTPKEHDQRGAQLSIKLEGGLLEGVMEYFEEHGIVVDERRPDVVRVAPAPLYNTAEDCWHFANTFLLAMKQAIDLQGNSDAPPTGGLMVEYPSKAHGWSEIT